MSTYYKAYIKKGLFKHHLFFTHKEDAVDFGRKCIRRGLWVKIKKIGK